MRCAASELQLFRLLTRCFVVASARLVHAQGRGCVLPPPAGWSPLEHGHAGDVAASLGTAIPQRTLSSELEVLARPWSCAGKGTCLVQFLT